MSFYTTVRKSYQGFYIDHSAMLGPVLRLQILSFVWLCCLERLFLVHAIDVHAAVLFGILGSRPSLLMPAHVPRNK